MKTKTKSTIGWVIASLLALAFLSAGASKVMGAEMQLKNLESWGFAPWLRFPIGLSEIGLAVALLLPNYRKWAIYAIYPWGIVAIITHLQATPPQPEMLGGPVIFMALNTLLLWLNKPQNTSH